MMRRALTLIEMITTITILAIAGATTLPLLHSMADTFSASARLGGDLERAAFAMERMVRHLREVPVGETPGAVAIKEASPARVVLSDGSGFELVGQTLVMFDGAESVPLCTGVETFLLDFIGADGVGEVAASPDSTATIRLTLRVGAVELRSVAMIRSRIGSKP